MSSRMEAQRAAENRDALLDLAATEADTLLDIAAGDVRVEPPPRNLAKFTGRTTASVIQQRYRELNVIEKMSRKEVIQVYEHFPRLPFLPAPYEEDGKTFIVLEHLHLDPLLIRFSQDSIHRTFQGGRTFERMYDDIAEGNLGIHQVPMIRVFRRSDKLFTTHDNRRLMIFQWLAEAGHIDTVRVEVVSTPIPAWQLNSKSDGL